MLLKNLSPFRKISLGLVWVNNVLTIDVWTQVIYWLWMSGLTALPFHFNTTRQLNVVYVF